MKLGPYWTQKEAQDKAQTKATVLGSVVRIYRTTGEQYLVVTDQETMAKLEVQGVACVQTLSPGVEKPQVNRAPKVNNPDAVVGEWPRTIFVPEPYNYCGCGAYWRFVRVNGSAGGIYRCGRCGSAMDISMGYAKKWSNTKANPAYNSPNSSNAPPDRGGFPEKIVTSCCFAAGEFQQTQTQYNIIIGWYKCITCGRETYGDLKWAERNEYPKP